MLILLVYDYFVDFFLALVFPDFFRFFISFNTADFFLILRMLIGRAIDYCSMIKINACENSMLYGFIFFDELCESVVL